MKHSSKCFRIPLAQTTRWNGEGAGSFTEVGLLFIFYAFILVIELFLNCSCWNVELRHGPRSPVLRCHKATRRTNFYLLRILGFRHTSHFRCTSLTSTCQLNSTIGSSSTTRRSRSGRTGTSTIQDHQALLLTAVQDWIDRLHCGGDIIAQTTILLPAKFKRLV